MKSGMMTASSGTVRSGKKPEATSAEASSNHRGGNGNQPSAEKLEQTLARLEVQIQALDQQLETVQNNPLELEQIWHDREQLSAKYNDVLAQWAEL